MPTYEQAHIIVDFEIDPELVFITIKNLSDIPALRLRIRPSNAIIGLGGSKDLSTLAIFKEISYLAPYKEIRVFVDEHESFFRNLKNTRISFTIAFEDETGKPIRHTIHHELAIYKDLIYFIKKK